MRFLTKLMDIRFRAEKEPALTKANTGIERGLVMENRQARGGLVGIPPLDKPLVYVISPGWSKAQSVGSR